MNDSRVPIKFLPQQRAEIQELADELSSERNSIITRPSTVMEAIKFYRENRPKPDARS